MLRRFGTSAQRLAFTRARPAGKPVPRQAKPAAPSNAAAPTAASNSAPNTSATSVNGTSSATGPATNSAVNSAMNTAANTTTPFSPRLVPEMATRATSTPVSDVVDSQEVVSELPELENTEGMSEDWATSFQGLGSKPFEPRVVDILMAPVVPADVEVTPDGLIYLPEIKYRRILNRAFGPGGWGIAPRTKTLVTKKQVTREYGLVCLGRLVSVSRGEMDFFSAEGVTTAMEGCKSNALMRCCKDLGIASELWDPSFIREFKAKHCESKFFEKKRRFVWKRKDRPWEYPYNQ